MRPLCITTTKRLEGYKDALRKHNRPIIDELIISYDLNLEKVKIYVKYLLDLPEPPDALFAVNDPTALEALLYSKARGLAIPEQIAIVGFSNDYVSAIIEPGLTTVAQPTREIGRVTALSDEAYSGPCQLTGWGLNICR